MILLNFAKSTHINLEFVKIYVHIHNPAGIPKFGATISFTETLEYTPFKFRDSESWIFFSPFVEIYYLFRGLARVFRSFDRHVFYSVNLQYKADSTKSFLCCINSSKFTALKRYKNLSQIQLYLGTIQKLVFILFFPSFQSIFKLIFSIAMSANYSFELISIGHWVPQFIGHNKIFLGSVYYEKHSLKPKWSQYLRIYSYKFFKNK